MLNIHGFLKDANIPKAGAQQLDLEFSTSPLPPEWIYVSDSLPVERNLNQRRGRACAEHHKNTGPNCHHGVLMWSLATHGPSLVNFKKTQNQPDGYNYILATPVLISSTGKKKSQTTEPPYKVHYSQLFLVCVSCQIQARHSSPRLSWHL